MLATSIATGCSGGKENANDGQQGQQAQKTCADLRACCDKVTDAEKKQRCHVVVDELRGAENADVGWSNECP